MAGVSLALLPGQDLAAAPKLGDNPFTLGVASGDPTQMELFYGPGWRRNHQIRRRLETHWSRWSGASSPMTECGMSLHPESRRHDPISHTPCMWRFPAYSRDAIISGKIPLNEKSYFRQLFVTNELQYTHAWRAPHQG